MTDEIKPIKRKKKEELVKELLALGYTKEQLVDDDGKPFKRPTLIEVLKEHHEGENSLNLLPDINDEEEELGVAITVDSNTEQEQEPTKQNNPTEVIEEPKKVEIQKDRDAHVSEFANLDPPTPNDPEWTQYVLGKFMDDEIDGKNPRVEGLRRIAGELVGILIEEGCNLVAAPTEENRFRACVKAWGVFLTPNGQQKRFEALADAHGDNCLEDFATYLVAMADTRAKGRMFRNALCLRRVVAAEEISKTVGMTGDTQSGGAIHTGQITIIRMMSDRYGFKIEEILKQLNIDHKLNDATGDVNLQLLSYEDALTVVKEMRIMKEQKGTE